MTSTEEWKQRARELGDAVAPVVGIALRCRDGDTAGLDRANARASLVDPLRYFSDRKKTDLAASIELLMRALELDDDLPARGAQVLACVHRTFPA